LDGSSGQVSGEWGLDWENRIAETETSLMAQLDQSREKERKCELANAHRTFISSTLTPRLTLEAKGQHDPFRKVHPAKRKGEGVKRKAHKGGVGLSSPEKDPIQGGRCTAKKTATEWRRGRALMLSSKDMTPMTRTSLKKKSGT